MYDLVIVPQPGRHRRNEARDDAGMYPLQIRIVDIIESTAVTIIVRKSSVISPHEVYASVQLINYVVLEQVVMKEWMPINYIRVDSIFLAHLARYVIHRTQHTRTTSRPAREPELQGGPLMVTGY